MTPIVAAGFIAAAAGAAYLYKKSGSLEKKTATDKLPPGITHIKTLTKGGTYAAMITLTAQDGRAAQQPIGTLDVPMAARQIQFHYASQGFKMLSAPVPRSTAEVNDFLHKNPSIWLFTGQWTAPNNSTFPAVDPPWLLNQDYTLLPVQ